MLKPVLLAGSAALALSGCTTMAVSGSPVTSTTVTETAPAVAAPAAPTVPDNLLLQEYSGPFGGVPQWDKVKVSDFPEALTFAIDEQRREFRAIADNAEAPTFANTIEAMQRAGDRLDRVTSIFGVYTDNLSTPEIQALDKEWSPKLSAAGSQALQPHRDALHQPCQPRPRCPAAAPARAHL
jgi:peptidyl-dipeptidase Dcp